MATNRQLALDLATRIANTKVIQGEEVDHIADKIIATAEKFADWLGPDPVRQSFGGSRQEKPTFPDAKCPICGNEMYDLRATRKSESSPIARCKNAGQWNPNENKFSGCQGVKWPELPNA